MDDQTRDYLIETSVRYQDISRKQASFRIDAFLQSGLIEKLNLKDPSSKTFQFVIDLAMSIPQLSVK
jgi:hypothetical protein